MSSSSPSPIALAALAGACFFLYRTAQAKTAGQVKPANYYNPVDVAGSLARLVVGITKGISTPSPSGLAAVQPLTMVGAANGLGLTGWLTSGMTPSYGGSVSSSTDIYNDWLGPRTSLVSAAGADQWGAQIDTIAAAPVYSTGTDFINNPFTAWAP